MTDVEAPKGSKVSRRDLLKLGGLAFGGIAADKAGASWKVIAGAGFGWWATRGQKLSTRLSASVIGALGTAFVPLPDIHLDLPQIVPEVRDLPKLPEGLSFAYDTQHTELRSLPSPTLLVDVTVPTGSSPEKMSELAAQRLDTLFGFKEGTAAQQAGKEKASLDLFIQRRRAPTVVQMSTERKDELSKALIENGLFPEVQRLLDEGPITTANLARRLTALREEARAAANNDLSSRIDKVLAKMPAYSQPPSQDEMVAVLKRNNTTPNIITLVSQGKITAEKLPQILDQAGQALPADREANRKARAEIEKLVRVKIAGNKTSLTITLTLSPSDPLLAENAAITKEGQKLLNDVRKSVEQLATNQTQKMALRIEGAFPQMQPGEEESAQRQDMINLVNRARTAAQKGLGATQLTPAEIAEIGAAAALGNQPVLKTGDRRSTNNDALELLRNIYPEAAPIMWKNFSPSDRKILIADGLFDSVAGFKLLTSLTTNLSDQELQETLLRFSDKRLAVGAINGLTPEQKVKAFATLTPDNLGDMLNTILLPFDPQPILAPPQGDIADPTIVVSQPGKEAELLLARQFVADILTYVKGVRTAADGIVFQPTDIGPIFSVLKDKISGDERRLRWFWHLANTHYHNLPEASRKLFAETVRGIQAYVSSRLVETADSNERRTFARILFSFPASLGMSVNTRTEREISPSGTQLLNSDPFTHSQTAGYLEVVNRIEPAWDFTKLLSWETLFNPGAALETASQASKDKDRYNSDWQKATRLIDGLNSVSAETVASVFARWFEDYNQDLWRYMDMQNHPILEVMRLVNRRSILEKKEFVLNEENTNIVRGFFMFLKNIPEAAVGDNQTWSPSVRFYQTLLKEAPLMAGMVLNLGLTRWQVDLLAGKRNPIHPLTGKETKIEALSIPEKRSALEQLAKWQILFSDYRWGILNALGGKDFSNRLNSLTIVLERLGGDNMGSVFLRHLKDQEIEQQFLQLSGVEHSADRDLELRVLERYGQGVKKLLEQAGWKTRQVDFAIPRFLRDTLARVENTTGTGQISVAAAGQYVEFKRYDQLTNTPTGDPVSFFDLINRDLRKNITFELVAILPDGNVLVQPIFEGMTAQIRDSRIIDDFLTPAAKSGIKQSLKEAVSAIRSNQPLVLDISVSDLVARKMIKIDEKSPPASVVLMGVNWLDKGQEYQRGGRKWNVVRMERPWGKVSGKREDYWNVVEPISKPS